jgi:hypothetical protein
MSDKIEFKTRTLTEFFEKNNNAAMLLPNFQRGFVWSVDKQRDLLASFIFDLPIGSILIGIGDKDLFSVRPLCFTSPIKPDVGQEKCEYLIDGQQRLSTLYSIFCDLWSCKYYDFDNSQISSADLKHRWFVKMYLRDSQKDIFGYNQLRFKKSSFEEIDSTNDLNDWLEYKSVNDHDRLEWWQPSYEIPDQSITFKANRSRFIKRLRDHIDSNQALMPLFDLASTGDSIQQICLKKIADSRMLEIIESPQLCTEFGIDADDKEGLEEHKDKWVSDIIEFFKSKLHTPIPYIEIPSRLFKERGINIFQSLNMGGTRLTNYDLIVAKAALEDHQKSLTDKICDVLNQGIDLHDSYFDIQKFNAKSLKAIIEKSNQKSIELISADFLEQFLKILCIVSSNDGLISLDRLKQSEYLKLTSYQINNNFKKAIEVLMKAYTFLHLECGLRKKMALPYKLMIIPIAYVFLRKEETFKSKPAREKIKYWFWKALFSGQYRENQNQRCVEHAKDLYNWIEGSENPFKEWDSTFCNVQNYFDKEVINRNEINSAMRTSFLMYLLSHNPSDMGSERETLFAYREKDPFDKSRKKKANEDIFNEHHVIPIKYYSKCTSENSDTLRKNKKHLINSIFNITILRKKSNQDIGGDSFDSYSSFLDNITLNSHLIPDQWRCREDFESMNHDKLQKLLEQRFLKFKDNLKAMFQRVEGSH